jgi:hypothetical protein
MIDPILLLISYISCSCACRPYTDSSAHYTTKPARAKSIGFFCQQRRAQTYDGWLLLAAVGSERTRRQPFAVVEVGLAERTGAVGVADGVRLVDTGRRI